jgi:hypothetical protein
MRGGNSVAEYQNTVRLTGTHALGLHSFPAIDVLIVLRSGKDVDARDKRGHDGYIGDPI